MLPSWEGGGIAWSSWERQSYDLEEDIGNREAIEWPWVHEKGQSCCLGWEWELSFLSSKGKIMGWRGGGVIFRVGEGGIK